MDDDDDDYGPVTRRMLPVDYVVMAAFFFDELAGAVHRTATKAYNLAAMHANHIHEQATFREEAALEIETLTGEVDG